jgi:hypothetical protein
VVVASVRPIEDVDVDRLELEGLYAGATRNHAAMAMASRKMLGLGWDASATVEFLMGWTRTMTNGLSSTAARLPCPTTEADLRRHYVRITQGILRGVATGKVAARSVGGVGRPVTDAEAQWIFGRCSTITDAKMRYRTETFLYCMTGFAKDRGRVAIGPARFRGADLIHAQLPAKVMQGWPHCGAGGYRRWLDWAENSAFTRMVVNYRHSQNPSLCRARTFELEAELDGLSGLGLDSGALLRAAAFAGERERAAVHPRQVEHALYAEREHGDALDQVYGPAGRLIKRLVGAYADAVTRAHAAAAAA